MPDTAIPASVPRNRFQWLDTLRGAALIAMASYHFMWDLADFEYLDAAFPSTGWPRIYARCIASSFLLMAGFSLVLVHGSTIRWHKFGIRFGMIVAAAALVSLASYLFMPQGFIFFGILHEMAIASLIGLLFLRLPWPFTIIVGIGIIAAPNYYRSEIFDTQWLWWVGLGPKVHNSFDYVPVFPWLGPFLIGMATARVVLGMKLLRQNANGITSGRTRKASLAFLGRHSLVFYLVHQPILISVLYVFSLVVPAPQVPPEVKYIGSCEMSCKPDRDANFCHKFCGCTLERLQQLKLLIPFQSGAISVGKDERIRDIAIECTAMSQ